MSEHAIIWRVSDAACYLSTPGSGTHKYSRGVLAARVGSTRYPGAAVLVAEAAWRTGLGSLRYVQPHEDTSPVFGLPSPAAAILARRPETVFSTVFSEDQQQCHAWLIGSGTSPAVRSAAETEALCALLAGTQPVVVDAGALDLVLRAKPQAPTILTPHFGEFTLLWRALGFSGDCDGDSLSARVQAATAVAKALGASVLLKGSRTIAASPRATALLVGPATAWLASAGTGDVLAGVLGSLLATQQAARGQGALDDEDLIRLGATAALLHDAAARIAAGDSIPDEWEVPAAAVSVRGSAALPRCATADSATGCPITALDVAEALPQAVRLLRSAHERPQTAT